MPESPTWITRIANALLGRRGRKRPVHEEGGPRLHDLFANSHVLRSAAAAAHDPNADEPLRLVLEDPSRTRRAKLMATTLISMAIVAGAGVLVWVWGYGTQRGNPGFWHITLVSLLFWLSISQGMVAFSAVLRIMHASWRYPINRLLDMASLYGLWAPALLPFLVVARRQIYALGASQYSNNVWRVAGSDVWDALAIGTTFVVGWMLLWLTSVPDFAMLRDRATPGSKERRFYRRVARWWRGTARQWRVLRVAEGVLVVGLLVSFVAAQTVLGWDFQLAAAHNWDSSIFAPLYTVSSLFGGVAMTVLVMLVTTRLIGPGFFEERHYESIGRVMIALGLVWFYFRWCDYLTAWYERLPDEWAIQSARITSFPFWAILMIIGCCALPVFANILPAVRKSRWALGFISVFILIGIAVQRYLDTVPTFAPQYPISALTPTLPSAMAFLGLAAMFVLTYLLAARYFPVISWWGTAKDRSRTAEKTFGNTEVSVMIEDPPVWET